MTVTLCGREYSLRFSVNALCCLEEKTGISLDGLQGSPMRCLRGLLWCGLMESCPQITPEDAGKMLDEHLRSGGSLAQVSSALALALEDACFFPKAVPSKKAAP